MGRMLLLVFLALFLVLASTKKWKLFFGLCLVFGVLAIILLFGTVRNTDKEETAGREMDSVRILFSEEKKDLIQDTEFRNLLKNRFGLVVVGAKYGSGEMPEADRETSDGVWAEGPFFETKLKETRPDLEYRKAKVFTTPLVIYSWSDITRTLAGENIVNIRNDIHYAVGLPRLFQMMAEGREWSTLGLRALEGSVTLRTAHPKSGPVGILSAYLISESLGRDQTTGQVETRDPFVELKEIYDKMGPVPDSGEALFSKFLKQGEWAFPLILTTERQVISFYQTFPAYREKLENQVDVLYPDPTVFVSHPFFAFTPKGEKLLEALESPEVQRFMWDKYGFRPMTESLEAPGFLKIPRLENPLPPPSSSRIEEMEKELIP